MSAESTIETMKTTVQNQAKEKRFSNHFTSAFPTWSIRNDRARKDRNSVVKPVRNKMKVMSNAS